MRWRRERRVEVGGGFVLTTVEVVVVVVVVAEDERWSGGIVETSVENAGV